MTRRRSPPISPEARAERAPPPPAERVEVQAERAHSEPGRARAARTVLVYDGPLLEPDELSAMEQWVADVMSRKES